MYTLGAACTVGEPGTDPAHCPAVGEVPYELWQSSYKGQKGFPEEEIPGLRLNGKQELRRNKEG